MPNITITVEMWNNKKCNLTGFVDKELLATDFSDNEENSVRLAEQMVRELFRKYKDKTLLGNN